MQQISISEKRAEAVDFSTGYFDVNQALIANNGSPAIGVTTLAGLKDLTLGAPLGTTSLQVIQEEVQPNTEPKVYPTLDLALKAMDNGDVDGVVVDFPTAFYGYADTVVGQFPNLEGQQEQFGLAFAKGNGFVPCVDQAIAEMQADGTLDDLKAQWLETDANVPTFS
jgi:polar amino acid transport system substrate-binding protein